MFFSYQCDVCFTVRKRVQSHALKRNTDCITVHTPARFGFAETYQTCFKEVLSSDPGRVTGFFNVVLSSDLYCRLQVLRYCLETDTTAAL
jgi:hypothetical protein